MDKQLEEFIHDRQICQEWQNTKTDVILGWPETTRIFDRIH